MNPEVHQKNTKSREPNHFNAIGCAVSNQSRQERPHIWSLKSRRKTNQSVNNWTFTLQQFAKFNFDSFQLTVQIFFFSKFRWRSSFGLFVHLILQFITSVGKRSYIQWGSAIFFTFNGLVQHICLQNSIPLALFGVRQFHILQVKNIHQYEMVLSSF